MTGEWVSVSHWGMWPALVTVPTFGRLVEKYTALRQARIAEPKHIRDEK